MKTENVNLENRVGEFFKGVKNRLVKIGEGAYELLVYPAIGLLPCDAKKKIFANGRDKKFKLFRNENGDPFYKDPVADSTILSILYEWAVLGYGEFLALKAGNEELGVAFFMCAVLSTVVRGTFSRSGSLPISVVYHTGKILLETVKKGPKGVANYLKEVYNDAVLYNR